MPREEGTTQRKKKKSSQLKLRSEEKIEHRKKSNTPLERMQARKVAGSVHAS